MAARLMPYDFMMAIRALPKRVARALPKSESAKTLVESSANKRGLSKMLDGTLREGAHDMRVFGLGFLRSVASLDEYGLGSRVHNLDVRISVLRVWGLGFIVLDAVAAACGGG
jgi:hypothetical protein